MTTVAGIDCGTNSIRLIIANIENGTCTDLTREMRIVRLGEGVDKTGRISQAALERTLNAVTDYRTLCDQHNIGPDNIRMVATSASRDAQNSDDFIHGVHNILGITPEVITGDEEAHLSFTGATTGLPNTTPNTRSLVIDLGGGSTEFVAGTTTVETAISVNMGCVRLTERHFSTNQPLQTQREAALHDIDTLLDKAASEVSFANIDRLVGVAGTVTTVTAHALNLPTYDSDKIHAAELPIDQVTAACDDLFSMSREDRAALGFMHPGRVDVIGAGALVWSRIVQRVGQDAGLDSVVTCEHDILDGIALSVAARSS